MTESQRSAQEDRVLQAARQYGRMKCHNAYVEDGYLVRIGMADTEMYLIHFRDTLLYEAKLLVSLMTADEVDGQLAV